jgi:hypothetical protein
MKTMTPVELCAWIDQQCADGKLSQAATDAVKTVILAQQLNSRGFMNMTHDQWIAPPYSMLGGYAHDLVDLKHIVS